MSLTTAEQVRLRVSDPFRYDSEGIVGDGTASAYKLRQGAPFSTLSGSGTAAGPTASIAVAGGWSATGCTFELRAGRAIFASAVWPGSAIQIDYYWSIFSEDEMEIFTAHGPDVPGMALEAIKTLMSDFSRRARWAAPDGSSYDDATTYQNLADLRKALLDEIRGSETGPAGDSFSFAETQNDWQ